MRVPLERSTGGERAYEKPWSCVDCRDSSIEAEGHQERRGVRIPPVQTRSIPWNRGKRP